MMLCGSYEAGRPYDGFPVRLKERLVNKNSRHFFMLIKYAVVCCIICSSSLWLTFVFHFQNVLTNFEVKNLGMFVLS